MARLEYKDGLYSGTRIQRWVLWLDQDTKMDNMARLEYEKG